MPYTPPATVVTATTITSAWGNSVKAATDFLANPPACRVYNSTAITIPDAGVTVMTFDSERFDTDAMHSTASLTGRITINTAGVYVVSFSGDLTSSNDYTAIWAAIRLNGTTYLASHSVQHNVIAWDPVFTVTTVFKFAAADYVEATVYADNTAGAANRQVLRTYNHSPEFSAAWVGLG